LMTRFLRALEIDNMFDWSISQSTLEEVFLRLAVETDSAESESDSTSESKTQSDPECKETSLEAADPAPIDPESGHIIPYSQYVSCLDASSAETVNVVDHSAKELDPDAQAVLATNRFKSGCRALYRKYYGSDRKTPCLYGLLLVAAFAIPFLAAMAGKKASTSEQFINLGNCQGKPTFKNGTLSASCNLKDYPAIVPCTPDMNRNKTNCLDLGQSLALSRGSDFSFHTDFAVDMDPTTPFYPFFSADTPGAARVWYSGALDKLLGPSNMVLLPQKSSVQDQFAAAQSALVKQKVGLDPNCRFRGSLATKGVQTADYNEWTSQLNATYPDYGIDLLRADNSTLSYTLYYYPDNAQTPFVNLFFNEGMINADQGPFQFVNFTKFGPYHYIVPPLPPATGFCFAGVPSNQPSNADQLAVVSNILSNAFAQDNAKFSIKTGFVSLPHVFAAYTATETNYIIFSTMVYVFSVMVFLPRFVQVVVMDRYKFMFEMMRIQGLPGTAYWVSTYSYTILYTVAFPVISVVVGMITQQPTFTNLLSSVLVFVFSTHALSCTAVFLSSLIWVPLPASLLSFLVVVASVTSPLFLHTTTGFAAPVLAAGLFPPIGMVLALLSLFPETGSSFPLVFLVWIAGSTLFLLLGIAIHELRPSPHIARGGMFGALFQAKANGKAAAYQSLDAALDDDVVLERNFVEQLEQKSEYPEDEAIRLVHLRKEFGAKTAVQDISMRIHFGETFGMLGPN
ncbi:hypothetical protein HDU91_001281, partial [Kappamyces sp. JEL0680]